MRSCIDVLTGRRSVPTNLSSASTSSARGSDLGSEAGRRLQGNLLVLARIVWIALATLSLAVLIASLPAYMVQLQSVCAGATCAYGQLSPDSVQTLEGLGLSTGQYTMFSVVLVVASALVWFGVGVAIFWRTWGRSDDWVALLVALL